MHPGSLLECRSITMGEACKNGSMFSNSSVKVQRQRDRRNGIESTRVSISPPTAIIASVILEVSTVHTRTKEMMEFNVENAKLIH